MLKFTQKNLGKGYISTTLAIQNFLEDEIDIGLYQEPYYWSDSMFISKGFTAFKSKYLPRENQKNEKETRKYKAITLIRTGINARMSFRDESMIIMTVPTENGPIEITNVYFRPCADITGHLQFLENRLKLSKDIRMLIGGDFNSKSTLWGNKENETKGDMVIELLVANNLHIANDGILPTYESANGISFVDLTIVTMNLKNFLVNWVVEPELDFSDHRGINYQLQADVTIRPPKLVLYTSMSTYQKLEKKCRKWKTAACNTPEELDKYYEDLLSMVQSCMKWKEKVIQDYKSFPWWTGAIRSKRNQVRALRRRFQKIKSTVDLVLRNKLKDEYKVQKKELSKMIRKGKMNSWRDFVGRHDERWGRAFKTVFHKKNIAPVFCENPLSTLRELFPERITNSWNVSLKSQLMDHIPINKEEVNFALHDAKSGKAPGEDGLPAHIWGKVAFYNEDILIKLFNDILRICHIPVLWKNSVIILIPKPGRDPSQEGAYRPISLLSTVSKLFEKILLRRINYHIKGQLDPRQFGFKEGVSTIDALERLFFHHRSTRLYYNQPVTVQYGCLFLDIKGAFNNFDPLYCLQQLDRVGNPRNLTELICKYFQGRKLKFQDVQLKNENGAPQGSCLGPLLWNMNVEGLLNILKDQKDILVQAFADDLVIYVKNELIVNVNSMFLRICDILRSWANQAGVQFAYDKCVYLSSTPRVIIHLDGHKIKRVPNVKYLGIILNQSFTPKDHIEELRSKSKKLSLKLGQMYGRDWGISDHRAKEIYSLVIEPSLTYGCSAWYSGTHQSMDSNLISAQRTPLLKLTNCFRTVASASLQILAGVVPLPLRIWEINERRRLLRTGRYDIPRYTSYHPSLHPITRIEGDPDYEIDNIFTDGSRNEIGSGASMVIFQKGKVITELLSKLDHRVNNYLAEIEGIRLALFKMKKKKKNYIIYTDSLSAVQSLTGYKKKHECVCNLLEFAVINEIKIRIGWVKAHNGDPGNEAADEAAKRAVFLGKLRHVKPAKSHVKQKVRIQTLNLWLDYWRLHKNGRVLFRYFRRPSTNALFNNFYCNMFNTNHGYFPAYFLRFNLREIHCICASPDEEADAEHYFSNCNGLLAYAYDFQRATDWATKRRLMIEVGKILEQRFSSRLKPVANQTLNTERGNNH
jgi:ribonuclease HI